jgi:MFS family permease
MTKSTNAPWPILVLAAIAIAGNYYAYDAIGPVADLLIRQRGLSQTDIGLLNAVYSLPNIPLALVGGLIIDKLGAGRAAFGSAVLCFLGAGLTAWGEPFSVMVTGRLIFGIGEATLLIALLVALAQWFKGGPSAIAMALFFSLARVGSYTADVSPSWAAPLYDQGWQPPLILAAGLTGVSMAAALIFMLVDRGRAKGEVVVSEPITLKSIAGFDRSFWYILGLNVLFASVFFPFRSTFGIVYFQDTKGLSLAEAGQMNSWVFFAAIFATPVFGFIADRFGRRTLLLCLGAALMPLTFLILGATHWSLWISTILMGISFSVIPAVIWPTTALLVEPKRLGTAFGLINVLQNTGLFGCNYAAGWLNDTNGASAANPAGYNGMLILFGSLSLIAFVSTVALWRRENGPHGHGVDRRTIAA